MKHIYLSPHLDDAVLSCGGAIHRRTAAGDAVEVITLVTRDLEPGTPLSAFAERLHATWGGDPQPFALRRGEDLAALALLGARARHLDYPDAIYRRGREGQWLYTSGETLFGEVCPEDPLAADGAREMAGHLESLGLAGTVYAPLAVGHHVDHQLVHAAARELWARGHRLAFYEDYPYGETAGATQAALALAGAHGWRAEAVPLSAEDLAAKRAALLEYVSQLQMLFGGAEAMARRVEAFGLSHSAGLCERIWWPT